MPVVAIAGLSAWALVSGPSPANGQSAQAGPPPVVAATQSTTLPDPKAADTKAADTKAADEGDAAAPTAAAQPTVPEAAAPAAPPAQAPPVNGLKISSQSWRRGGLGSNALVTFTLRNKNDYAVKDVEIACTFARKDGSHLTDRTRVIPGTVEMKSRKTFARLHVGFVNVNANKARCALVAANRM